MLNFSRSDRITLIQCCAFVLFIFFVSVGQAHSLDGFGQCTALRDQPMGVSAKGWPKVLGQRPHFPKPIRQIHFHVFVLMVHF